MLRIFYVLCQFCVFLKSAYSPSYTCFIIDLRLMAAEELNRAANKRLDAMDEQLRSKSEPPGAREPADGHLPNKKR